VIPFVLGYLELEFAVDGASPRIGGDRFSELISTPSDRIGIVDRIAVVIGATAGIIPIWYRYTVHVFGGAIRVLLRESFPKPTAAQKKQDKKISPTRRVLRVSRGAMATAIMATEGKPRARASASERAIADGRHWDCSPCIDSNKSVIGPTLRRLGVRKLDQNGGILFPQPS
jgi:hypothetical protein